MVAMPPLQLSSEQRPARHLKSCMFEVKERDHSQPPLKTQLVGRNEVGNINFANNSADRPLVHNKIPETHDISGCVH